jgi:phage baseplate assembly protein W
MAFGARSIFPIDTKPSTAVGVALPFNAPAVFNSTYTTADAIKYNMINFFLTNPGERYLNPQFGAGLRGYVFQQIAQGTLEFFKEDIQQKVAKNFPNVIVQEVNVYSAPSNTDENQIIITLKYSVVGTAITDDLQITFN